MSKIFVDKLVLEQALEAMLNFPDDISDEMFESITALKAALAESAQEPDPGEYHGWVLREVLFDNGEPVGHREPVQEPVAWLRVIDEAMVTHHCGVAHPNDDYETAKQKMNTLLCIAQDISKYFEARRTAEPVAWRTFDGEGGWDYRDYENNEDYIYQYVKRNGGKYAHWVEPLYTAPPQRKPITEEEIEDAVREADLDWQSGWTLDEHEPNRFTTLGRLVERAHGIGE